MPDVEGVMLQGESSWVALDKDRISYVLDWYENIQDPGPGLPMLPILALLIAGCIYFFGWIVIGAVAAIALVISVGTMIYDASH
ncbi:MAG: hypothetical protein KDD66_06370, partial [Bdellovibrionales bacterium]|nr:hypothetical protein [Bdellovibrionales bacterium]